LFKKIKKKFTEKPILKIYQLRLPIRVETDTLNFTLEVCMVQRYNNRVWHPVTYYSKKMTPLKLNYDIYNKELLAIITVLKEWRVFL
jgi:RNase H-like domain found in reverse transcriptase